jgi:hypothetical protein
MKVKIDRKGIREARNVFLHGTQGRFRETDGLRCRETLYQECKNRGQGEYGGHIVITAQLKFYHTGAEFSGAGNLLNSPGVPRAVAGSGA